MNLKIIQYIYFNSILKGIYNRNLETYGFTPEGLFWSSKKSQYDRFTTFLYLIKSLKGTEKLKIADVGCGYGSLLVFLKKYKLQFSYVGYDINEKLINYCNNKYFNNQFICSYFPTTDADISIISGTYNYAVTDEVCNWEKYIIFNLKKCFAYSKLGLIFNLQFTKQKSTIRNNIYYTNIDFMMKQLRKNFANVSKFYSSRNKQDIYFIVLK